MNIVVATCKNMGIGINNNLPWRILGDTLFFKYLTIGNENNAVIMGKNTFLSLPKPLPHRDNFILSSTINEKRKKVFFFNSINNINLNLFKYTNIYLIGGEKVYFDNINKSFIKGIYHTKIHDSYDCDTFFPKIPEKFNKIHSVKFNDIDKKNKKKINFDIDVYYNTEFNEDSTLSSGELIKDMDMALNKLKIHHDISCIKE
tara:strand:+ start:2648 stop:3253 length:606 start_codon:yes stop_codon:yes gene_type:complete